MIIKPAKEHVEIVTILIALVEQLGGRAFLTQAQIKAAAEKQLDELVIDSTTVLEVLQK